MLKQARRLVFRTRQRYWKQIAPGRIASYMEAHPVRKLQIGAGENGLDDWLNTTLFPWTNGMVFMDGTVPFPIPDASFDYVFSEHVIEHIPFLDGKFMLEEAFRILKPGGKIRIATPNLQQILSIYSNPEGEDQQKYIRWITSTFIPHATSNAPVHVVNQSFHGWRHVFIYDPLALQEQLESAGFVDVNMVRPYESDDTHFQKVEQHGDYVASEDSMLFETMVFEAQRPE